MSVNERFSLGMDIGSTKVTLAMMMQHGTDPPELLAYATHRKRFLKNGIVADMPAFQETVGRCLSDIQNLSKSIPRSVSVNIDPDGLQSETSTTEFVFKRRRAVRKRDMMRVKQNARFMEGDTLERIHIFPLEYALDDQQGLDAPLGMKGTILKLRMQEIYAPRRRVDNIVSAVNACKLMVAHVVADPYAQLEALTLEDERDMGLILINIGEYSVKVVAVKGKHVTFLPSIPLGAHFITSDISIGLRTTMRDAERVKIMAGAAVPTLIPKDETMDIPVLGNPSKVPTSRQILAEIIGSRVEEILEHVQANIDEYLKRDKFHAGFMITGGTAGLAGLMETAEQILGLPGIPATFKGFTGKVDARHLQEVNTAIGLALYGLRHRPIHRWGEHRFNVMTQLMHFIFRRGG